MLLLLLLSVWAIGVLLPALPPVMPLPWATLQVYVVPVTELVNAIDGAAPLQMDTVDGVAVIAGVGFTVIVVVAVALQPAALPVII